MRHFYKRNADGTVGYRRCQEHTYHPKDLHPPGHPHAGKPKIGPWPLPIIKSDDEHEFDHLLTDSELELIFPGQKEATEKAEAKAALRHAIDMTAQDDEWARCFDAGLVLLPDIPSLDLINKRLKLRGKPIIGGL